MKHGRGGGLWDGGRRRGREWGRGIQEENEGGKDGEIRNIYKILLFSLSTSSILLFLKVRKRESGEVYYKRKRKGEEKRKGLEIYKILPLFLLFFLFMQAKIIRK